jgi:hypothetical protein
MSFSSRPRIQKGNQNRKARFYSDYESTPQGDPLVTSMMTGDGGEYRSRSPPQAEALPTTHPSTPAPPVAAEPQVAAGIDAAAVPAAAAPLTPAAEDLQVPQLQTEEMDLVMTEEDLEKTKKKIADAKLNSLLVTSFNNKSNLADLKGHGEAKKNKKLCTGNLTFN